MERAHQWLPASRLFASSAGNGRRACRGIELRSIQGWIRHQGRIFPNTQPEKTCVCDVGEILWPDLTRRLDPQPTCAQLCFSVFTVVYCVLFFVLPFTVKCTTKVWFQIERFIFWLWWKRAFRRRKMEDCSFILLMQVSIIFSSVSSFSTVVSYLLVRVEFWLNDPSFAKHDQATGKNQFLRPPFFWLTCWFSPHPSVSSNIFLFFFFLFLFLIVRLFADSRPKNVLILSAQQQLSWGRFCLVRMVLGHF